MNDDFKQKTTSHATVPSDAHCDLQGRAGETSEEATFGNPEVTLPDTPPSEFEIERRWLLLSRVDTEQYVRFYDKYYDLIYGSLLNRTRNPDLAEELCQATFVQGFEKRWQFKFQGVTFGAWLFRIAMNLANQEDRKHKVHNPVSLDSDDDNLVDTTELQDEELLAKLDNEDLVRCLQEIGPECQSWLTLHFIEGRSTPELAAIAGVPQGTMKARLSRCMDKLKLRMRSCHD